MQRPPPLFFRHRDFIQRFDVVKRLAYVSDFRRVALKLTLAAQYIFGCIKKSVSVASWLVIINLAGGVNYFLSVP